MNQNMEMNQEEMLNKEGMLTVKSSTWESITQPALGRAAVGPPGSNLLSLIKPIRKALPPLSHQFELLAYPTALLLLLHFYTDQGIQQQLTDSLTHTLSYTPRTHILIEPRG